MRNEGVDYISVGLGGVALLCLLLSAIRLASVDTVLLRSAVYLLSDQQAVPRSLGEVSGFSASGDKEWTGGDVEDAAPFSVLFPISETTALEQMEFWAGVAAIVKRSSPTIEFIGVCASAEVCSRSPVQESLRTLSFMSPLQMHALAIARETGNAYLQRGQGLLRSLKVLDDDRALATEILTIAEPFEKGYRE